MRIVICDDDPIIVEQISKLVNSWFAEKKATLPEVDVFFSGDKLLEDKEKKDIVFLDVEMPGLDGIYTGKKLLEENKQVIIIVITSYSEYLDDAMRMNVFRYLSKPLDTQRFKRNLEDAVNAFFSKEEKQIVVETSEGINLYNSSEIIMLEMTDRKVFLHTEKETISTDLNLKEWKDKLPDSIFFQSHRSFIVNITHIKKITPDKVMMDKNNMEAYLSRRKYPDLKKIWMLHLESSN